LIVFDEVVATDGAVTERRKQALHDLTDRAGFDHRQIAFVTAYADRDSPGYRKTASALAWGSFAWFYAEPDNILIMREGIEPAVRLSDLKGV
jgi:hypothetical protein